MYHNILIDFHTIFITKATFNLVYLFLKKPLSIIAAQVGPGLQNDCARKHKGAVAI
jgi:hypothetical protein